MKGDVCMYAMDATKKVMAALFVLSGISFVLMLVGFALGGGELLAEGYMNYPTPSILMFVGAGVGLVSLLAGIALNAIQSDVAANLRYMDQQRDKPAK